MSEMQINAMTEAVAEALETLAFVSPMPAEHNECPESAVAIAIPFFGPRRGTLQLAASRQFGAMLAANILGTEPADPEAQQKALDALRELANIACGLWLRKTGDAGGGKFEMQVPQCSELATAEQWTAFTSQAACVLDAEGFLLAAGVAEAA